MSKVRLYGFEECPFCEELKKMYDDNHISYHYIDINDEKNDKEVNKIMELGKSESVPIILVNKTILSPENSFNSIKEAYLLTNRFLSQ